jgi:hypothetical protein
MSGAVLRRLIALHALALRLEPRSRPLFPQGWTAYRPTRMCATPYDPAVRRINCTLTFASKRLQPLAMAFYFSTDTSVHARKETNHEKI